MLGESMPRKRTKERLEAQRLTLTTQKQRTLARYRYLLDTINYKLKAIDYQLSKMI